MMGCVLSLLMLGVSAKCAHVVHSGLYEKGKGVGRDATPRSCDT